MADITASMVMDLRGRTGLPMMECKKALTESAGDMAKAEELLRIRSGAKASKAADRVAAEGVIGAFIAPDGKTGAMVELNCETDFVARNADFIAFARRLAQLIAEKHPADVAALVALPLEAGTVESARQALVQKLGENISIRRFSRVATPARLAQYVHGGRIGVLVVDDGVGFDKHRVLDGHAGEHNVGLYGMIERTELAGGRLTIRAAPGKGVAIRAVL